MWTSKHIIINMKKLIVLLCVLLCATGCVNKEQPQNKIEPAKIETISGDAYGALKELIDNREIPKTYSVGVISKYIFQYGEEKRNAFSMDGVLESSDNIHLEQNINSNGLVSNIEGYYYGGKLYSTYNGISYYEEMDKEEIKKTLLFPIDPYLFDSKNIKKIEMGKDENNYLVFVVELDQDIALDMFISRYDIYGLNTLDDVSIKENRIIYRFDDNDFVRENSEFVIETTSNGKPLQIDFTLNVNYFFINDTNVEISEELKSAHQEYVNYKDIDINSISEVAAEDSGDSVVEIFKNRIQSRLGYKEVEDREDVYRASFNENETYTIDFNNSTFMYTNYSIDYSYSWKGDIGSMGACSFDYKKEIASSECNETTIETLKDTKSYLEMELYYCGLTFEELINE